jgi:hypothetical protein
MKTETYTNRYKDEFIFTELENGNIQWDGDFTFSRYAYVSTSADSSIDMVDPSGGPYMASGMKQFDKVIKEFKRNENGYEIITEK